MKEVSTLADHEGVAALLSRDGLGRLETIAFTRYVQIAATIVLVGLFARIAVAVHFANVNPSTANTWEYGDIALTSLQHGGIVGSISRPDGSVFVFPTAFMPPLPVFLWIGLFWIFGVSQAALAVMIGINVVCGTAIVVYTMRIAKLLFRSNLVALIAGAIMALHPVFAYSVATYEQLNLYILLFLVTFDLSSSRFEPTVFGSIAIGVLLGLMTLVRTEYLVLGFAVVVGSYLRHRRLRLTVLTLIVGFLLVVPWTIRNYVVFHRFIPVADSVGYNLFKGFNPEANGSGHWVDEAGVAEKMLGAKLAAVPLTKMNEVERDDVYKAAAERFIARHPIRSFVVLPVEKASLFWLFDVHDPTTRRLVYQLQFWPIFILSIIGLGFAAKNRLFRDPDHRLLLIVFASETIVMAAYAVHARYRMNVEPFLFGYAALGALVASSWARARVPRVMSEDPQTR